MKQKIFLMITMCVLSTYCQHDSLIVRAILDSNGLFDLSAQFPGRYNDKGECFRLSLGVSTGKDIKKITPLIGKLTKLRKFGLSNTTYITQIPDAIGSCTNLKEFHIKRCPNIKTLPASIGKCDLRYIDITETGLETLPNTLDSCKFEMVILHGNKLRSVPDALFHSLTVDLCLNYDLTFTEFQKKRLSVNTYEEYHKLYCGSSSIKQQYIANKMNTIMYRKDSKDLIVKNPFVQSDNVTVSLISPQGRVVLFQPFRGNRKLTVPMKELSYGVYYVQIANEREKIQRAITVVPQ